SNHYCDRFCHPAILQFCNARGRGPFSMIRMHRFIVVAAAVGAVTASLSAQQPAPGTARALSPIDLTGNWVSIVTEDWRFRMVTPPPKDYASVPLNAAAR